MAKENKGPILLTVAIVCYVLAFIGTILRVYVRQRIVGLMGLDDWLIVASLALYTMYIAFVITGIHYGTGQHHADLEIENLLMAVRYWYFCEWAYVITMTVLKMGIGVFYLRLMVSRWQQLTVKCVMLVCLVFGVSYFACVVAQCVPVPHIWNRFDPTRNSQGGCLPHGIVLGGTYLHSIISAGSDWILGLLPIAMLWHVRLGLGIKIIVSFLLGLGAIASTATLIRIGVIHHITEMDDFLWRTFGIAIWSTVEPGVALFACGLAALRPLLRSLFPSRFRDINLPSTIPNLPNQGPGLEAVDESRSKKVTASNSQENSKPSLTENDRRAIENSGISRGSREITIGILEDPLPLPLAAIEQSRRSKRLSHLPQMRQLSPLRLSGRSRPSTMRSPSYMSTTSREVTVMFDGGGDEIPPVPAPPLSPTGSKFTSRSNEALGWNGRSLPPLPTEKRNSTKAEKRKSKQRETWDNINSILDYGGKAPMADDKKGHDKDQKGCVENASEVGSGVVSEYGKRLS